MIALTIASLARAVDGQLADVPDPNVLVTGPMTADSRRITPGGIFAALPGQHTDGHLFADGASRAGASVVLAARPVGVPAIVVADVWKALPKVAAAVLARASELTVIGITGSVGKTTTKDMLGQLLGGLGPVVVPEGSFNNDLGVPVTVTQVTGDTRYLVVEMGMNSPGEIARHSALVRPVIGVELLVGHSHIGKLGSREKIAEAKAELVEALPATGHAILNADDDLVRAMAARTAATPVYFGLGPAADVRATEIDTSSGLAHFTVHYRGESARIELRYPGVHQVHNALAAVAVALTCGMSLDEVAQRLSQATPVSRWRMELTERPDGVTIINDAYNASPESVAAALDTARALAAGRRVVAILGELGEVGAFAGKVHSEVGALAAARAAVVIGVGDAGRAITDAAQSGGCDTYVAPDRDDAIALAGRLIRPGDVVLVKASRLVGLEKVAMALAEGRTKP